MEGVAGHHPKYIKIAAVKSPVSRTDTAITPHPDMTARAGRWQKPSPISISTSVIHQFQPQPHSPELRETSIILMNAFFRFHRSRERRGRRSRSRSRDRRRRSRSRERHRGRSKDRRSRSRGRGSGSRSRDRDRDSQRDQSSAGGDSGMMHAQASRAGISPWDQLPPGVNVMNNNNNNSVSYCS